MEAHTRNETEGGRERCDSTYSPRNDWHATRNWQVSPYLVIGRTRPDSTTEVVDVGRWKIHRVNATAAKALERCKTARNIEWLLGEFGSSTIQTLTDIHLLVDPNHLWDWYDIRRVEIETGTYCNWSCEFCPNREAAKPKQSMDMDLFKAIITKAARHASVESVTLHSYNEPTIDKDFETRVKIVAGSRLKLDLYTNGSGLTESKLQLLRDLDVVRNITFNVPSIDQGEFERLTGAKTYQQSMEHIDSAIKMGFKVKFAVIHNGSEQAEKNLTEVRRRFRHRIDDDINGWATDRGGILTNEFGQAIDISEPYLQGCYYPLNQLNIGVEGNCFICCEDFYQKETFGRIQDGEIGEILNNPLAKQMRRRVFGGEIAPENFICRKCNEMKRCIAQKKMFAA